MNCASCADLDVILLSLCVIASAAAAAAVANDGFGRGGHQRRRRSFLSNGDGWLGSRYYSMVMTTTMMM